MICYVAWHLYLYLYFHFEFIELTLALAYAFALALSKYRKVMGKNLDRTNNVPNKNNNEPGKN